MCVCVCVRYLLQYNTDFFSKNIISKNLLFILRMIQIILREKLPKYVFRDTHAQYTHTHIYI